jgi:hypothetical protein
MNQKTPKFNEALGKYFSELELDEKGGQERTCRFSDKKFYITAEDIKFYKKIGVPLPTLSPHERMRGKLGFFNLYNLFYGKSDKTGKKIVSSYPSDTPYKIYEHAIWNDIDFTNTSVGYDQKKSFFEQYKDFQLKVPRPNLVTRNIVNSDYSHATVDVKNCYFVFDTLRTQDSQFSAYINDSKNCYYTYATTASNICYENSLCDKVYKCFFSEFSNGCVDSAFLFDCRNCNDCFMCTNLRHKSYCFENEQLSKEEYQRRIKEVNLGNRDEVNKLKSKFKEFKKKAINRANHNEKNVNCTGDYNTNSKNCSSCFYIEDSEDLKYMAGAMKSRDCMDSAVCLESELVYGSMIWDQHCYNVKFSVKSSGLRDSEYCDLCKNCNNCFACIGLKNKSFCIFNKQYSEKSYWEKIDEIKTKMLLAGEYGEFFPPELSPTPYQTSSAVSFGGYDDIEVAEEYGYDTEESPDDVISSMGVEIVSEDVPDDIKDVFDDILQKTIISEETGKKFRYTKEQLEFHRKYNLALPTEHYSTVLARKRIALGPIDFDIRYRNCCKCKKETQVTFPENHPDAPTKIYCEKCYNKAI